MPPMTIYHKNFGWQRRSKDKHWELFQGTLKGRFGRFGAAFCQIDQRNLDKDLTQVLTRCRGGKEELKAKWHDLLAALYKQLPQWCGRTLSNIPDHMLTAGLQPFDLGCNLPHWWRRPRPPGRDGTGAELAQRESRPDELIPLQVNLRFAGQRQAEVQEKKAFLSTSKVTSCWVIALCCHWPSRPHAEG